MAKISDKQYELKLFNFCIRHKYKKPLTFSFTETVQTPGSWLCEAEAEALAARSQYSTESLLRKSVRHS